MKLDKDSRSTVIKVYIAALVAIGLLLFARLHFGLSWWVVAPLSALLVFFSWFITFFFRVPERTPAGDNTKVTAVADGKIVILKKVYEPLFIKQECIQVSIYMDFFDVHACFWPLTATVKEYRYYPGKHLLAFKPKASLDNEHTATLLLADNGKQVLFKQLAGGFARRIVCYSKPGLRTKAGEQCGVIKFGSRIDIFLPLDVEIHVRLGEQVRACETVIATL